jgi:N-acetylmuramoyl-L-alanine amidase
VITTASGHEIMLHRRRPEATRDGALRDMPGPPREAGKELLLPAKATGSLLGCAVRWDPASRTLYLHPWLRRFTLETQSDRYRLTLTAEAPIGYRTGELSDPPRLYVDLLNMDLAQIPTELTVAESYLKSARVKQNTLAPDSKGDVVRLVVEMSEDRQSRIGQSVDGCKLWLDFPLPEAKTLPPDVPPVVLTGMSFERPSGRIALLKIETYGAAVCQAAGMYDPKTITFDITNAQNQLKTIPFISDRIVKSVSLGSASGNPGAQRLTIVLKEPSGYSFQTTDREIKVLFGNFELGDLKLVIDAGHGGVDSGAVGQSGLDERVVNLDIARRVFEKLTTMGAMACLTRTDESSVRPWRPGNKEEQRSDLLARCSIANEMAADLFVSIHCNATGGNRYARRGTETYYRRPESLEFARVMQREVVAAAGSPDGGVFRHPKSIVVLQYTEMPAVLVEVSYLSHPEDEALLATDSYREQLAQGIANGIVRYVQEGGLLARLAEREAEVLRTPAE